jgi:hypothetical protein
VQPATSKASVGSEASSWLHTHLGGRRIDCCVQRRFASQMASTAKGFKVTDAERKSRVGIAAKTLDDLKKKTVDKFKLKLSARDIFFQTQDGTLVESDDYFQTLHAQTLLVWVKNGEKAETDAEILYKTIREVNDEYLSAGEKVQEFFTEKMKSKVFKLAEVLRGIDGEKAKLSLKCDHPEWFEGESGFSIFQNFLIMSSPHPATNLDRYFQNAIFGPALRALQPGARARPEGVA